MRLTGYESCQLCLLFASFSITLLALGVCNAVYLSVPAKSWWRKVTVHNAGSSDRCKSWFGILEFFQAKLSAPCFPYLYLQVVSCRTKVAGLLWGIA